MSVPWLIQRSRALMPHRCELCRDGIYVDERLSKVATDQGEAWWCGPCTDTVFGYGRNPSPMWTSILRPGGGHRIARDTPLGIQGPDRHRATRTVNLEGDVL